MLLLESPKSIIHAGIYWLTENATTCMVIFHIGIYGIVVPGHYQHKHCHYCSNNHYSIPSVTYVYLFILDVE